MLRVRRRWALRSGAHRNRWRHADEGLRLLVRAAVPGLPHARSISLSPHREAGVRARAWCTVPLDCGAFTPGLEAAVGGLRRGTGRHPRLYSIARIEPRHNFSPKCSRATTNNNGLPLPATSFSSIVARNQRKASHVPMDDVEGSSMRGNSRCDITNISRREVSPLA
jgi:hypothetical protein